MSSHCAYGFGSPPGPTAARIGRRSRLGIIATLSPSVLTAYSSSTIASAGVYIGIIATGVSRSLNSRNCSAENRLKARQVALRISSSADKRDAQRRGRIKHREIHPHIAHPLIHQLRQHRSCAVERVLGRHTPPYRLVEPALAPLLERDRQMPSFVGPVLETVGGARPSDLLQVVHQVGSELDPVAVGIDHRMTQASPQGSRFGTLIRGHIAHPPACFVI